MQRDAKRNAFRRGPAVNSTAGKRKCDYWDTKFKGFGVRVSQGGTKTFVLNVRKARRSLGRYGMSHSGKRALQRSG
jgi:hypothetical protein